MLLFQTREDLVQYRHRPTTFVNLVGGRCICGFETGTLALLQLVQGNQLLTFASFNCHGTLVLVRQEMLQRCEQVRTQASFFLANGIQIPALEQERKKPLREIFCLLRFGAMSPHETINGPPVGAAEFFERCLCSWRGTLCLQDHAPVCSRKGRRTLMNPSANCAQRRQLVFTGAHITMESTSAAELKILSLMAQSVAYSVICVRHHWQSSSGTSDPADVGHAPKEQSNRRKGRADEAVWEIHPVMKLTVLPR